MFSFLTADGNSLFLIALLVVLMLAILEGVLTVIGAGLSQILDSLLPDSISGANVDLDLALDVDGTDISSGGFSSSLLAWLRIGQVPLIVSFIVLLVAFGLIGLIIQGLFVSLFGILLSKWIVVLPTFFAALPVMAACNAALARIIPRTETSAVSTDTFIGRVATITLGTARVGKPAQAKLLDEHRHTHYVMVEPDPGIADLKQGEEVLLTEKINSVFRGIRPGDAFNS